MRRTSRSTQRWLLALLTLQTMAVTRLNSRVLFAEEPLAELERIQILRYSSLMQVKQFSTTTTLSPVFPVGSSCLIALISLLLRSQRQ